VSAGVVAGLIWIGFAAHRPSTGAVMAALVERIPMPRHPAIGGPSRMARSAVPNVVLNAGWGDIGWYDGPVVTRRGTLQRSMTRSPDITPGEGFSGYPG
jgi:hypothetical protein